MRAEKEGQFDPAAYDDTGEQVVVERLNPLVERPKKKPATASKPKKEELDMDAILEACAAQAAEKEE